MPSPDVELDLRVNQLGNINVPDLVRYLCDAHPQASPYELAIQLLEVLRKTSYEMAFDDAAATA